jgi:hypothetical protein
MIPDLNDGFIPFLLTTTTFPFIINVCITSITSQHKVG